MQGKSRTVTAQRKLNIYLEHRPDGDKGVKVVAYGTPGLTLKFVHPSGIPVRGWIGTPSALYSVNGGFFYFLTPSGVVAFSTPISTTVGSVEIAYNNTQIVVVDGSSGYIFNGYTLSTIGAAFPSGARSITFVSGFFIAEQPNSQKFWVSNVFDGSTWNALAVASASQASDNIVAVDTLSGILVIFSQSHMEFWQNVGASTQPFAPILSAANQWGLGAFSSRVKVAESIIFLGLTSSGQVQVCRLQGYAVSVISTSDVDSVINEFVTTNDAVAMTYQIDTHAFYQITFPSADRSFLYDCSTGIWSEVQTGHTTNYATRHVGNLSTLVAGQTYVSDWASANVYLMDPNAYTDNGVMIERELITRHALDGYNEFTVDEVFLDVEVGVGLVTGQGSDPRIMMQVSRDSGKTYETEQWIPMGVLGAYMTRCLWRRQGSARIFDFKVRYTEPTKFVIANAALSVREAPQ